MKALFFRFYLVVFIIPVINSNLFSQSVNEELQFLTTRLEGLNSIQKNNFDTFNLKKIKIETSISFKNKELVRIYDSLLLQKEEFNAIVFERTKFRNEVDSLLKLYNLPSTVIHYGQEEVKLIDPPEFIISDSELIKNIEKRMIETCPVEDVLGNKGPERCTTQVTSKQYFTYYQKIRLIASLGFSFSGSHADVGNNGFILMEYKNSKWEILDFLEFKDEDAMQWGKCMIIDSINILGKYSVGLFSQLCTTAAGEGPYCGTYIMGCDRDKLNLFFQESSLADVSQGLREKGYMNYYKLKKTTNDWYDIERNHLDFENNTNIQSVLKFNELSSKYE